MAIRPNRHDNHRYQEKTIGKSLTEPNQVIPIKVMLQKHLNGIINNGVKGQGDEVLDEDLDSPYPFRNDLDFVDIQELKEVQKEVQAKALERLKTEKQEAAKKAAELKELEEIELFKKLKDKFKDE